MRRRVLVGGVPIGDGAPIVVQSMTNTDTSDVAATVAQIRALRRVGCEIVRVAVRDETAVAALPTILEQIDVPLVADIHFDHRLALGAIAAGVDKLRLNPGNIREAAEIARVAEAALEAGIPIRVGANGGSLDADALAACEGSVATAMVESALREIRILERHGMDQIVVSLKGTDVLTTVGANRMIAEEVDYPLHIGVTEAGLPFDGSIRSAAGLGILLFEGLGDTIRVSLAGDPLIEVRAAYALLRSLGLRDYGIDLIVCPTCGRTRIDLVGIAEAVREGAAEIVEPVKVALMGCEVNGPGEVAVAEVGLVGGRHTGVVYVDGVPTTSALPEDRLADAVLREIRGVAARKAEGGDADG